jgi:hypothetical protein
MYFDEKTDKYFGRWICLPTWNTFHPCDTERFHAFVKALYHHNAADLPGTDTIEQAIVTAVKNNHPDYNIERAKEQAKEFAEIAQTVIDFLYDTRNVIIPDVQIENRKFELK